MSPEAPDPPPIRLLHACKNTKGLVTYSPVNHIIVEKTFTSTRLPSVARTQNAPPARNGSSASRFLQSAKRHRLVGANKSALFAKIIEVPGSRLYFPGDAFDDKRRRPLNVLVPLTDDASAPTGKLF